MNKIRSRPAAVRGSLRPLILLLVCCCTVAGAQQPAGQLIDGHLARYDEHGHLLPWTTWSDAIDREVEWYLRCPWENGYPRFITMTFMDENYKPQSRRDFIPATQNGLGILSYLKYYHWKKNPDPRILRIAVAMGNFLVKETLTPNEGKYPRFTRSTGWRDQFPFHPDSGSQSDRPFEIEPDKGGIAGYALVLLYNETHDQRFLDQALQNARVLTENMAPGDATHSPWPFRADYRTGEPRGPASSDMVFILRLYDELVADGYPEFRQPRSALWRWIKETQLPDISKKNGGLLWVQFFEDHDTITNRNSWAPLNLARYLVEQRDAVDRAWQADAKLLIDYVIRNFTSVQDGVLVCGEQDEDKVPWGGALSTFGAVLAQYSAATGDFEYKGIAWQALTLGVYATSASGAPRDSVVATTPGGWQEDAHTDKIHNFVDAMSAFPGENAVH